MDSQRLIHPPAAPGCPCPVRRGWVAGLALLAGGACFLLVSCESTRPRGPQPKSSYIGWDHPKKGQGAGPLGGFMPQQGF